MLRRIRFKYFILASIAILMLAGGIALLVLLKGSALSIILSIMLFIGVIVLIFVIKNIETPDNLINILSFGIDVKGKSRTEYRDLDWCLEQLSPKDISEIEKRFIQLESLFKYRLSLCENMEDYYYFFGNIDKRKLFEFTVYRSFTKYRQYNYVKTPYKSKIIEEEYKLTAHEMMKIMSEKYGIICKFSIPNYVEKNRKGK